ncbi:MULTISPECIES: hypothetical protein [Bacillus]|uniref:hypothetical protein n=1 Tax=Bacillus TaxID=1386 RepID=UPI00036BFB46|nr:MULTISPECIES: hypothetical protein [Bacillus]PGS05477.1 hypothetical protein COC54_11150 [Bacillus pseudomycoides]
MSVSIYYSANRKQKLTTTEQEAIDKLILEYSVDKEIEKYHNTGEGYDWEDFTVYNQENLMEDDEIFAGSTRLPDNGDYTQWEGFQHWNGLLSQIRCVILGAEWHVNIDDHVLVWDEEYLEYVLPK